VPDIFSASTTKEVHCPDGTSRFILKRPERAFAIAFPDWDAHINGLVKFLSGNEVKIGVHVLKKTQSLVSGLTENYAIMQAQYSAVYLGWCGNPCSMDAEKAWQSERKKILEKETVLRELVKKTSSLKTTRKRGGILPIEGEKAELSNADLENISNLNSRFEYKEVNNK
jgi:hypothetical protein